MNEGNTHSLTHGLSKSKVYKAWCAMRERCYNPRCGSYKDYGGRGIGVCERWVKFENFFADMGHPPDGTSIERRDNRKGYEPSNCFWATRKMQQNNTRRNKILVYNGRSMTLTQWAEEIGLLRDTLRDRLRNGWTVEKALSVPRQAEFARVRKPTK